MVARVRGRSMGEGRIGRRDKPQYQRPERGEGWMRICKQREREIAGG